MCVCQKRMKEIGLMGPCEGLGVQRICQEQKGQEYRQPGRASPRVSSEDRTQASPVKWDGAPPWET